MLLAYMGHQKAQPFIRLHSGPTATTASTAPGKTKGTKTDHAAPLHIPPGPSMALVIAPSPSAPTLDASAAAEVHDRQRSERVWALSNPAVGTSRPGSRHLPVRPDGGPPIHGADAAAGFNTASPRVNLVNARVGLRVEAAPGAASLLYSTFCAVLVRS